MGELIELLAVLWILSPVVLFILLMLEKHKSKSEAQENYYLKTELKYLREKLDEKQGRKPADTADRSAGAEAPKAAGAYDYSGVYAHQSRTVNAPQTAQTVTADTTHTAQDKPAADTPVQPAVPEAQKISVQNDVPAADIPVQAEPVYVEQPAAESGNITESAAGEKPTAESSTAETSTVSPVYTYSVPQYRGNVPAPEPVPRKKIAPINIILALGTLFVSLAGFVFAGTQWSGLPALGKGAVLISFSVLFFILHLITEKKLDLPSAGKIFYILGSVFLPAAVFSAAVLKVFGNDFSFSDGNGGLVIAVMALCTGVCALIGAVHYDSRRAARFGYIALSLTAASASIYLSSVYAAIELSVVAFAVMLFEGIITRSERVNKNLKDEYGFFVSENIYVCALVSLFLSDGSHIFAVPVLIFSAAFLISAIRRNHGGADISAFCAYLAVGAYLAVRPESLDSGILILALLMIIYSVLSFMDMIPEELRKIVSVIRMIVSAVLIAAGLIMVIKNDETDLSVMFAAVCVLIQLMITAYKGDKASLYALAPAVVFTACEASKLADSYVPAVAVAICLVWLVVIRCAKSFYTRSADVIITLFAAVELVHACARRTNPFELALTVWVLLMICTVICTLVPKDKNSIIGAAAAAVAALGFALPIYHLTLDGTQTLAAVAICQTVLSVLPLVIPSKSVKIFTKPLECGWAVIGIVSFISACTAAEITSDMIIVPVCAALYFAARSIVIRYSKDTSFIFDFGSDAAFCIYFAGMLFIPAKAGYLAVIFVCLIMAALLSDIRVRMWALPAALLLLFIPAREYLGDADRAGLLTASVYGLAAAAAVYTGRDIYRKFIYLFPALFVMAVTAVDTRCILTVGAIGTAAMLSTAIMHIRKQEGPGIVLSCVTCAAYIFATVYNEDLDGNIYYIIGLVLWLFTVLSFALGKDIISQWLLPVALISLYFPIYVFSTWENINMINETAGAASAAVFIIGMYLTGGKRTSFKATAPLLLLYPVWITLSGYDISITLAACTAVMTMIYSTSKKEGRSLRRLAALCITLGGIFILSGIAADDTLSAAVCVGIWLCITAVFTREHRISGGLAEGIAVLAALVLSYISFDILGGIAFAGFAGFALVAAVSVMSIYRLLCMTGRLLSDKLVHFIMPLAMIMLAASYNRVSELTALCCAAGVFAVSLADAYGSAKNGLKRYIYPSFAAFIFLAYQAAVYICAVTGMSHDMVYIAVTAAALLIMLLSFISDGTAGSASRKFTFAVMPFMAAYMLYSAVCAHNTAVLVCGYILSVISAAAAVTTENTLFMYLMLPVVHLCTYAYIGTEDKTVLLTLIPAAAAAVFGRIIFSNSLSKTKLYTDAFSLTAVFGILPLFSVIDDTVPWWGGLALAVWFLMLYRKGDRSIIRHAFLTLAACMVMPLFWFEPFFEIPLLIKTEVLLIPPVIALVLLYLIHREHRPVVDTFAFATAVIELLILFFDAAKTGYAFDAVFLGAVILCILGLSFIFRQKRWFALAVCSAAAEALLMTIKLYNSRIWWVYLLIAGIILIAVGLGNEMKKKRIEQGKKTKLERVMEEWTW